MRGLILACTLLLCAIFAQFFTGIDAESRFFCHPWPKPRLDDVDNEVPFFWKAEQPPESADDITIIVSASSERIRYISALASSWQGPMSVAIYVINVTTDIPEVIEAREANPYLKRFADIHIHMPNSIGDFPVNRMRNLAWKYARTNLIIFLDSNFWTPPNLRKQLMKHYRKFWTTEKTIWIIPAFQMVKGQPGYWDFPKTKRELKLKWVNGNITMMHGHYPPAQDSSEYTRYLTTRETFTIDYHTRYEPYMLARRDIPVYDERYKSRGCNKNIIFWELDHVGYEFKIVNEDILDTPYLVHICEQVYRPEVITSKRTYCTLNDQFFKETRKKLVQGGYDMVHQCPDPVERQVLKMLLPSDSDTLVAMTHPELESRRRESWEDLRKQMIISDKGGNMWDVLPPPNQLTVPDGDILSAAPSETSMMEYEIDQLKVVKDYILHLQTESQDYQSRVGILEKKLENAKLNRFRSDQGSCENAAEGAKAYEERYNRLRDVYTKLLVEGSTNTDKEKLLKLQMQVEEGQNEVLNLKKQNNMLEEQVQDLKVLRRIQDRSSQEVIQRSTVADSTISTLQAKYDSLSREFRDLHTDFEKNNVDLQDMRTKLQSKNDVIFDLNELNQKLEEENNHLDATLKDMNKERESIDNLREDNTKLQRQLSELSDHILYLKGLAKLPARETLEIQNVEIPETSENNRAFIHYLMLFVEAALLAAIFVYLKDSGVLGSILRKFQGKGGDETKSA